MLPTEVTIDLENTRAVIELEESLDASFIPFNLLHVERIKIITVLDLAKDEKDGKYYIQRQYGKSPQFVGVVVGVGCGLGGFWLTELHVSRCVSIRSSARASAVWLPVWMVAGVVYADGECGGEWDGDGWLVVKICRKIVRFTRTLGAFMRSIADIVVSRYVDIIRLIDHIRSYHNHHLIASTSKTPSPLPLLRWMAD